ncbi:transporter substrate-binding domain-containing protein [Vibrio sp. SCSIO 43136]|nr:HD domain-containing phosphohydrolase [Vibrio sp. SCSIO 43136]USD66662.1 transporter substrate-binding domain-containing protein [Vibrio sp. SCSIO 43136]
MFVIATILTACIAIFLQYYFSKEIAKEHILSRYTVAATSVSEHINQLDSDARYSTQLLAKVSEKNFNDAKTKKELIPIFVEALKANSSFYSIYIGDSDEHFVQLINLDASALLRDKLNYGPDDCWVLVEHFEMGGKRYKSLTAYNEDFVATKSERTESNFFPTQRPWFNNHIQGNIKRTEPYLFHLMKVTGQTYSTPISGSNAVLGIDIVLSSITEKLRDNNRINEDQSLAEGYLFSDNGQVIASNKSLDVQFNIPLANKLELNQAEQSLVDATPTLKVSNQNGWAPIDFTQAGEPKGYAIDLLNMVAQSTGLSFEYINGRNWSELVRDFKQGNLDILHSRLQYLNTQNEGVFSLPMYSLPFGLVTSKDSPEITRLSQWDKTRLGILSGSAIRGPLSEQYPQFIVYEYDNVNDVFEALRNNYIDGFLDTAVITRHKLAQSFNDHFKLHTQLVDINTNLAADYHLVMHPDNKALVSLINRALAAITPEQRNLLKQKWLEAEFGKPSAAFAATVPYRELMQFAQDADSHNMLHSIQVGGIEKYFYVTSVGNKAGLNEYFAVVVPKKSIMKSVTERLITSIAVTTILMAGLLPIAWFFGSPIVSPITQLRAQTRKIKQRRYDEVDLVDTPIKEIYDLSTSVVNMASELQRHEKAHEELFEAIIKLIAQAIDDKSPYTAGHCNRVPEIGLMLASAAEKSNSGTLAQFKFANDDERREFRIAAWLHDCGKITSPEHVIDKGTKLEAIYNRIHEIRMRFEVLWRDAEISALKQAKNGELPPEVQQELEQQRAQLKQDFEFIANANVGGEFMDDESIARIKAIAKTEWTRYFDDRVGLSPAEELHITSPAVPIPAKETLLGDKPEHIVPHLQSTEYDPSLGIKIQAPEHLYNLGEIYNLCIRRGTLTQEDRFKVNEHMISGIKMLERLPFPPELSRVPRYASTHHETLKGSGYPRQLTGKDLSIPERILVIADIFEALTASDRPYKKAKPLSVAIDIMYKMASDEHFDLELFQLFLTSGVYLDYAKQHLPEWQIDDVDISKYL